MAICKNCGAQYSDTEERCPYCGASREGESQRIEREDQLEYERERQKVKALPKQRARKRTRIALAAAGLLLAGIVIWTAVSRITDSRRERQQARREAEASRVMEEYFQAGSYEELYEYYNSLESHSPSDDKYWEVGSAWSWMDFVRESQKALDTEKGPYAYYGISYALSGGAEALRTIEEGLSDGVTRGNEEVLRGFETEILGFFREDLQMTDEEIDAVMEMEEREEFDAMDAKLSERLGL